MKHLSVRIKILKALYQEPKKTHAYGLARKTGISYAWLYRELKRMSKEGLIFAHKIESNQNTAQKVKHYRLTAIGRKLAKLYLEIDKIYSELLPLKN